MNPSEDQRKRDCHRRNAAPEQKLMHPPPGARSFAYESLPDKVRRPGIRNDPKRAPHPKCAEELERLIEEAPRRRLVQPDGVVVHDSPCREDNSEGIDH